MRGMDRYIDHQTTPISERYELKNDCAPPCYPYPQAQAQPYYAPPAVYPPPPPKLNGH
jgi:hypothetical protein